MKINLSGVRVLTATVVLFVSLVTSLAQSGQPWPEGVPDIVKLAQANVSDATIVAYIQNTGLHYNLNAGEIIMLKQQGLSDQVLNAMLQNPVATAQPCPAVLPAYVVQPEYVAATPPPPRYYNPFCYFPPINLSFVWNWGGGWHCGGGWHH
jgi:hypothetical protein